MNLKEGRVGNRETVSLILIGLTVSGLFYPNAIEIYRFGNASYMSAFLSYALLLLLFLLLKKAMQRRGAEQLGDLMTTVFGNFFGRGVSLMISLFLVGSCVFPLARFLLLMKRFVFPNSDLAPIAVYLLLGVTVLSAFGFEPIARTARLLVVPFLLSLLIPIVQASSSFEWYRLFPLPLEQPFIVVEDGVERLAYGLPAILSLFAVTKGVHGLENASKCGKRAILLGGCAVIAVLFCIGLTFTYVDLQELFSPIYRLLLTQHSGVELRTDKLILFVWIVVGLIAISFYLYSAALLFCRTFRVGDVRVPAVVFASIAISCTLLAAGESSLLLQGIDIAAKRLYWIALIPVLASLIAFCKRKGVSA